MIVRPLMALVAKDLRVFFQDRYAAVLCFAAPVALASFMAMIFGGAGSSTPSRIEARLVDGDGGPFVATLLDRARANGQLELTRRREEDALDDLRRGRVALTVIVPPGFGDAAAAAMYDNGPAPELELRHDPTRTSDVAVARGLLTRLVVETLTEIRPPADSTAGLLEELVDGAIATDAEVERAEFLSLLPGIEKQGDPGAEGDRRALALALPGLDGLATTGQREDEPGLPFRLREESAVAGGEEGRRAALAAHAFAGMVVQFVLFSAVEWGVTLLQERRRGLWNRLRASAVPWGVLMASKVLGSSIVAFLVTSAVFGAGAVAFRFGDFRALPWFLALTGSFAWAAANFGLLLAALGKSPQGARSVAILGILVLVMLGGGWVPTFLFPLWLQQVTPIIPTRWAIDGFNGVLVRGYGAAELLPTVGSLLALGAGCATVASAAYHRGETT